MLHSVTPMTSYAANHVPVTSTGHDSPHPILVADTPIKENLAPNLRPPRHLLTKKMTMLLTEMRGPTAFAMPVS